MPANSKISLHEDLTREDEVTGSSERSFGITCAVVFAIIAAIRFWHGSGSAIYWLIAAAVMLGLAYLWTAPLRPLNRLWFRLALVLYKVVNPIMMGLLFYSTVVPTGLLMRACGKDPLRLRRDAQAQSYWIVRTDDGAAPARMKNQF